MVTGLLSSICSEECHPALPQMKTRGTILTGLLPLSCRSITVNVLKAPFTLLYYLGTALSKIVKGVPVASLLELKHALVRNWEAGIQDCYQDLSKMSREEARPILEEGLRYSRIHQYVAKPMECFPFKLHPILKVINESLTQLGFKQDKSGAHFSLETGTLFNLSFDENKKELMACFWGLGNQTHLLENQDQWQTLEREAMNAALTDFIGLIHPSVIQAIQVGELLKREAMKAGWTPVVSGHSHGGGLAQCAAIVNDIKGVVFNSRPIGAGTRWLIGQNHAAERGKNITAFSVSGDFLTANETYNCLSIILERVLGLLVPRTIGQGYFLPGEGLSNPHVEYKKALSRVYCKIIPVSQISEAAIKKEEDPFHLNHKNILPQ